MIRYIYIYIYIYILALACAFTCTDSSGSGDKVDQGAQYRGAACCYHNFSHNLYHSSCPFHRERERPKANELTHESKTDQHAWLTFCHHVVEISVSTSISIKIVCGRCANMCVCGCSVPMLGRGEGLPGVSKACLSKACLNLLGPAWKPVWPAWGLVWAAYKPVWLAGRSA